MNNWSVAVTGIYNIIGINTVTIELYSIPIITASLRDWLVKA